MTRSRPIVRILTVAAAVLTLSGCSGSDRAEPSSSPQQSGSAPPAAAIPRPNSGATGPVVQLPGNPAVTASGASGPTVDDLYRQGQIEVVR